MRCIVLRFVATACVFVPVATADAQTWTGGGADNNWTTAANWSGGVPASATTTNVTFSGSTRLAPNQNIASPLKLNTLTFGPTAGSFNLQGSGLDFNNNYNFPPSFATLTQNSPNAQTVSAPLYCSDALTVGGSGAGGLTLAGPVYGTGSLTMSGSFALTLAGAGSSVPFVGVSSGTVLLGASNVLTAPSPDVSMGSGTFNLNGASQTLGSLEYLLGAQSPTVATSGGILTLNGNVSFAGGSGSTAGYLNGLVNLNGAARTFTFNAITTSSYDLVVNALLTGSGASGLQLAGDATAFMVLNSPNTYAGATTLSGGTLFLGVPNALPSTTAVNITSGTLSLITHANSAGVTAGSYNQSIASLAGNGGIVDLGSATLTVGTDNSTTNYFGQFNSAGGALVKVGTGGLVLFGTFNGPGSVTVNSGLLGALNDTVLPAVGPVTVNAAGTLRYLTNSSTSRTFTLNSGRLDAFGVTLTLNGATVNGGFLHYGTFSPTGGAALNGVTSLPSATISHSSGAATYVDFTNGGSLAIASAVGYDNAILDGFTNAGSGSITLGTGVGTATTSLTIFASDFQSYGTLTLNPAKPNSGAFTQMSSNGVTPLYFNGGSRTFIGTPATASALTAGIDLHGTNAIVAGGLFVNNGYVTDSAAPGTATVVADFGSLVKGAGFFQNSVQTVNGGKFQSGNSPGQVSFGSFTFGPGGVSNYVFAVDDAAGTAGPSPDADGQVSGWGLVRAVQRSVGSVTTPGDFTWTADPAHKLTFALQTLLNPTTVGTDIAGPMADFDPTRPYVWPAVEWAGTYSGPADPRSLTAATVFNTSSFANPIAGTFGWSLDAADHMLSVTYTPSAVPEPGTLVLVGAAAACGLLNRRRIFRGRLSFLAAVSTLLALTAGRTVADDNPWTGATNFNWSTVSGNNNWSLFPGYWSNGFIDGAFFNGAVPGTVTVATPITLRGMSFNANGYTISGAGVNPLTLTHGISGTLADGEIQVANGITGTVNATLAGTVGLIKTGPGTLQLGSPNAYAGLTTIIAGTLKLGAANSLPTAGDVLVESGTFNLNGFNQIIGGLTLGPSTTANPSVATGTGTVTLGGNVTYTGGTNTLAGLITGNLNLGGASRSIVISSISYQFYDVVASAPISGSGGLTQDGAAGGFLALNAANTYSGPTTINNGSMYLGITNALPAGTAVNLATGNAILGLNPPTTALGVTAGNYNQEISSLAGAAGSVVTLGTATLTVGAGADTTFAGQLIGGTLVKTGFSTLTLTGLNNSANIMVQQGGLLQVSDLSTGGTGALGSGTFTMKNDGILVYAGPSAVATKPITLNTTMPIQVSGEIVLLQEGVNLTLNGVISESAPQGFLGIAGHGIAGSATLTLGGSNSYTGPTDAYNGATVAVATVANGGSASPIGASSNSPVNLMLATAPNDRATLLLTGTNANYATDRGFTVGGNPLAIDGTGGVISIQNATTTLTVGGQLIGSPVNTGNVGNLIKAGAGTLILTNATNSYANATGGGTSVEGGTLVAAGGNGTIPAGSKVTVAAGATLKFTEVVAVNGALGTVALQGGTLLLSGNGGALALNQLTMTAGSTLDLTRPGGAVVYFPGAAGAVTVSGNASWLSTSAAYVLNQTSAELPVSIAANATLSSSVDLSSANQQVANRFRVTGGGTLYLTSLGLYTNYVTVSQASSLRLDVTAPLRYSDLTLDVGTLKFTGPSVTLNNNSFTNQAFTLAAGGGTVEVTSAATTLTVSGQITGPGMLTKTGPGTLKLTNSANSYSGGTNVVAGTLIAGDPPLGTGPVTVGPAGTLLFQGAVSTGGSFTLNSGSLTVPSGSTLTLDGASVYGGFLRGTGTFALTGGTTLTGVTTAPSTTLNAIGPTTFTNFTNGSPLMIAVPPSPCKFDLVTNQGSGSVTVGASSQVLASDYQTYGVTTLSPGTSAAPTQMSNTGASNLFFNGGSRTFISIPSHAGQFDAGIDLMGHNAVVAGGLLVNNGYVVDSVGAGTKTIVADFGSLVKGAGFFQNSVQTVNGGKFQSGNSPGSASFGSFTFGPGGVTNYVFAIDDATGTAGPSPNAAGQVSGWGLVKAVQRPIGAVTTPGDFAWTADPAHALTIHLDTLVNPTTVGTDVAGQMADFDPNRPYSWLAAEWTGTYSGPTDTAVLTASTTLDTSGFFNPIGGTFGWSLDTVDHTLSLTYAPSAVPEPSTLILTSIVGIGLVTSRRRAATARCCTAAASPARPASRTGRRRLSGTPTG
jgi:autotransporter-associated beta strand protein